MKQIIRDASEAILMFLYISFLISGMALILNAVSGY